MLLSTNELRSLVEGKLIYILAFTDEVGNLSVIYGITEDGDPFFFGFNNVDCCDGDLNVLRELVYANTVIAYNSQPLRSLGIKCIDYKLYRWYYDNVSPVLSDSIIDLYTGWYPHLPDPATVIPIAKVLGIARKFVNNMMGIDRFTISKSFLYYHDVYYGSLLDMASHGIGYNPKHSIAPITPNHILHLPFIGSPRS